VIAHGTPFEVTTLREDVETFGRRANVAFTDDWAADARRRDFTINAFYCTADGDVFDPLGGLADLAQRRVRFIGDAGQRIREDYLRILRFFRLHAEYGAGAPDEAALQACVRERGGLASLSAERVRAELVKLLVAPRAVPAIESMVDHGLLAPLLNAASRMELLARTVEMEAALGQAPDAMLRLSALAIAVEEDVPRIADLLRLSNAEREELQVIDARAAAFAQLDARTARRQLYRLGPERWRRKLLGAAIAGGGDVADAAWRRLYDLPETWPPPRLALRGADVLALGVAPGPAVGELLDEVEAWWIEGDFAADEAALRQRLAELARRRTA
jgi:tRNA nucleotidyltransferase/poly(A) polymerase